MDSGGFQPPLGAGSGSAAPNAPPSPGASSETGGPSAGLSRVLVRGCPTPGLAPPSITQAAPSLSAAAWGTQAPMPASAQLRARTVVTPHGDKSLMGHQPTLQWHQPPAMPVEDPSIPPRPQTQPMAPQRSPHHGWGASVAPNPFYSQEWTKMPLKGQNSAGPGVPGAGRRQLRVPVRGAAVAQGRGAGGRGGQGGCREDSVPLHGCFHT